MKKYNPRLTEIQISNLDINGVYAPFMKDKEKSIDVDKNNVFFKSKELNTSNFKIRDIEELRHYFDLKAVYQRGEVWPSKMKKLLFSSILNGVPIGCVNLVKYANFEVSSKWYVLDGLQRLSSVISFLENEFSICLTIDGEDYEMTWEEMLKCQDPRISVGKVMKIRQYDLIAYCEWEYMSIQEQADMFEVINSVLDLKPDEKIYCPRFHTKKLMEYIIEKGYGELSQNMSNDSDRLNLRQKACRTINETVIMCFGDDFSGSFNIIPLDASMVKISAQKIHNLFVLNEMGSEEEIEEKDLKKMRIYEQVKCFIKLSKLANDILRFKNPHITKKYKKNEIYDFLLFLFKKIKHDKTETFSSIQNNISLFYDLFSEYVERRKTLTYRYKKDGCDAFVTEHTTSVECINSRLNCLDEIYDETIEDKGIKNKTPNEEQRNKVRANADVCKCNRQLTDDNIHIDHVVSTKISSGEEYQALCSVCNLRKSGALVGDLI